MYSYHPIMYWSVKLFGWPFTPHNANLSIQRIHNKHNLMLVKFPRVPVTLAPWYTWYTKVTLVHMVLVHWHYSVLVSPSTVLLLTSGTVDISHTFFGWLSDNGILQLWASVRISLWPDVDFQWCHCVCISSANLRIAYMYTCTSEQPIALLIVFCVIVVSQNNSLLHLIVFCVNVVSQESSLLQLWAVVVSPSTRLSAPSLHQARK